MEDQEFSNFLSSIPPVTQSQKQAGYDANLLQRNGEQRPSSIGHEAVTNVDPYYKVEEGVGATARPNQGIDRNPRFWRTRKGVLLLVALVIIIIGAIVGGAVGGTLSKKTGGSLTEGTEGTGGLGPNNSNSNQGTSPNGSGDDS
ncbi:hypothetical protein M407DRAFT_246664, partial [Tulasnella calospora MUT 4182]